MKHLKIEGGKGHYSIDGTTWSEIDRIGKDDILELVNLATTSDFELDPYNREQIPNPAHEIIYRNLASKFTDLIASKDRFRDESQQLYREALQKYRAM
jgi:hypothetical protein